MVCPPKAWCSSSAASAMASARGGDGTCTAVSRQPDMADAGPAKASTSARTPATGKEEKERSMDDGMWPRA